MDYGRTSQINNNGDFFAANPNASLEASQGDRTNELLNSAAERDQRNIGGKVMGGSHENDMSKDENTSNIPEYGKIINLNLPPNADMDEISKADPAKIIEASFDRTAIKTGDIISPDAIKEMDKATNKLNQTGDIADFYDTIRDAMEVNLDNSYNRKLAA